MHTTFTTQYIYRIVKRLNFELLLARVHWDQLQRIVFVYVLAVCLIKFFTTSVKIRKETIFERVGPHLLLIHYYFFVCLPTNTIWKK